MKIKKLFALSFVAVGITALASCGDKQFTEEDVNNKVNEAVDKANQEAEAQKNAALAEKEAALKKAALDELKTTAKTNVDSYKVNVLAVAGITEEENEDIAAAVSTAKTAIEAATTNEEVATAYKNGIDSIKAVIAEILEGIQADLDEEAKILAAQLSNAKLTAISDISKFNSAENYYVNTKDDGTVSNLISVATTAINAAGSLESIEALKTQTKNAMAETFLALFEASFVEISTAEELFAIRNQYNDNSVIAHNYRLTKDIDLSGFEIPTYEVASFFKGVFDGQGHVISNGSYTAGDSKDGMLFKTVLGESTIKNVKFLNCVATSTNETIAIIAGECNDGEVTFDGIEFNSCAAVTSGNYVGLIFGRNEGADKEVHATIKNITVKNSSYTSCAQYGGLLVGDIIKNASVDFENLDITGTLKKSSGNGAILAGRARAGSSVSVKNAVLDVTSDTPAKIAIVGGGSESLTNLTVENVVIKNTNMNKLTYTAPTNYQISNLHFVSSETITNLVLKDTAVEAATVEASAITPTWLKDTLKLDFENSWVTEGAENAKYRLAKASTNVKGANAVLTSIKLNADNATKRFKNGTDFSYEGLLVTGVYNDGVQLVLSAGVDYTVDSTAYNKTASGDYIIRINANPEGEDVPALKGEYTVKVATQTGIKINTEFANKTYYLGSKLDTSEVVAYTTWDDNVEERVSNAKEYKFQANFDENKAGLYKVNVTVGKYTKSYDVVVVGSKPVVVDTKIYINVNKDASITNQGDKINGVETFTTLTSAIDYLASCNYDENVTKVIYVADGTYNEKITVPASLTNLKLIGESQEKTIITYSAVESTINPVTGAAYGLNKVDCATVHVDAVGFGASNITIRNDFDYVNNNKKESSPQGLALTINGDQAVLNNVYLYGNQDTLYIKSGRLYVKGGKIDGNIDFIFGNADGLAFFDATTITAISRDGTGTATNTGYVTAMKATAEDKPDYGYIFNNCTFTRGENVAVGSMSLGRPWGPAATVAYINCNFDSTYSTLDYNGSAKSRWFDMSGNSPVNADFCEYGSTGAGAITEAVNGGKVLTAEQAANYTMANIFAATNGKCKWSAAWDATAALTAQQTLESPLANTTDIKVNKEEAAVAVTVKEECDVDVVAYVEPWNASNKEITITIADPNVCTYDGLIVHGLIEGTTTITLSQGDKSLVLNVTVQAGIRHNITYDATVADGVDTPEVTGKAYAIEGLSISAPEVKAVDGYVLKGWYTDSEYKEQFIFGETKVTEPITLHARWVKHEDLAKENVVYNFANAECDNVNTFASNINHQNKTYADALSSYGLTIWGKKFQCRYPSNTSNADAQVNAGTFISLDVKEGAFVTFKFRSEAAGNIKVGYGSFVDGDNTIFTDDAITWEENGFVEMTGKKSVQFITNKNGKIYFNVTGSNVYLESISVNYQSAVTEDTTWSFRTDTTNGNEITNTVQGSKELIADNKLVVDATAGKLAPRNQQWAQFNTNTKLEFYVLKGTKVEIKGYEAKYSVNDNAATDKNTTYTATADGIVVIKATADTYIDSISITVPKQTETNKTTYTYSYSGENSTDWVKNGTATVKSSDSPAIVSYKIADADNLVLKTVAAKKATLSLTGFTTGSSKASAFLNIEFLDTNGNIIGSAITATSGLDKKDASWTVNDSATITFESTTEFTSIRFVSNTEGKSVTITTATIVVE